MNTFNMLSALALMWVPLHLFLAGYYLVFHLRERERDHLLFAGLWFVAALYSLACAGLYSAASPEDGLGWQKIQFLGAAFFFPLLAIFLWRHALGHLPRGFQAVMLLIGAFFSLASLFTPWFWSQTPSVKSFTLFGQSVTYYEMAPGWLGLVCFAWGMLLLLVSTCLGGYAFLMRRPGSLPLLVGLTVLILCGVNDFLVSSGLYSFLYLVEHGFPVFAFAAAYFMQSRVLTVRAALATRSAELERANAELERTNTELERALEQLSTLDHLKEDLLANVSHDLRTPLVSIRGYVEVILAGKLGRVTSRQEEGLRIALRNTNRLLGLIGNLLDYAKLQDGRLQLQRRPIDLGDVLRDAVDTALPLAKDHGLGLTTELPRGQPLPLCGDAAKLQQVLDNLLHNAVKYTDPGGSIHVRAERCKDGSLRVLVRDTGVGIPAAEEERIFDRFYRGQSSVTRGVGGAGIGLSIARSLVRLHGGELRALSIEGAGACLELTLPGAAPVDLTAASEAVEESFIDEPSDREPQDTASRPTLRSPRLLLVDDDRDVVELFSLALGEEGCDVQVAENGDAGLVLARSQLFDLVLLDLTMRGMSGLEVLEALRIDPATARLPVVVVTALGGDEVRLRCLSAGADDFLVKPVPLAELRRVVYRVLRKRSSP